MKKKTPYLLEIIWLIVALLGLFLSVSRSITHGVKESYMLYIVTVLSFAMFGMRRYLRKTRKD